MRGRSLFLPLLLLAACTPYRVVSRYDLDDDLLVTRLDIELPKVEAIGGRVWLDPIRQQRGDAVEYGFVLSWVGVPWLATASAEPLSIGADTILYTLDPARDERGVANCTRIACLVTDGILYTVPADRFREIARADEVSVVIRGGGRALELRLDHAAKRNLRRFTAEYVAPEGEERRLKIISTCDSNRDCRYRVLPHVARPDTAA